MNYLTRVSGEKVESDFVCRALEMLYRGVFSLPGRIEYANAACKSAALFGCREFIECRRRIEKFDWFAHDVSRKSSTYP